MEMTQEPQLCYSVAGVNCLQGSLSQGISSMCMMITLTGSRRCNTTALGHECTKDFPTVHWQANIPAVSLIKCGGCS